MAKQEIIGPGQTGSMGAGWSELKVRTISHTGEVDNETTFRSKNGEEFLDIAVEAFVGISRRSKYTTVRLEGEAAAALKKMLST